MEQNIENEKMDLEQVQDTAEEKQLNDETAEKGFKAFMSRLFKGEKIEEKEQEVQTDHSKDEETFQERLKIERLKWEEEQKKQKEYESLPDEEKQKAKEKENEEKIKQLEHELLKKELKDEALSFLNKEGYPAGLVDLVKLDSKEEMEKSLQTVTQVFRETLKIAVNERLRGKTPAGLGQASSKENQLNDEIAKAVRGGF